MYAELKDKLQSLAAAPAPAVSPVKDKATAPEPIKDKATAPVPVKDKVNVTMSVKDKVNVTMPAPAPAAYPGLLMPPAPAPLYPGHPGLVMPPAPAPVTYPGVVLPPAPAPIYPGHAGLVMPPSPAPVTYHGVLRRSPPQHYLCRRRRADTPRPGTYEDIVRPVRTRTRYNSGDVSHDYFFSEDEDETRKREFVKRGRTHIIKYH